MALADTVQNLVFGVLSNTVDSFKQDVTWRAYRGDNGRGEDDFHDPVTLRCIVDPSKKIRFTQNGTAVMTFATLLVVDPITEQSANSGFTREQPIDPRDLLILEDGGTAPVVDSGGAPNNPATGRPFALRVILGTIVRGQ